jgi:hypothetical protein
MPPRNVRPQSFLGSLSRWSRTRGAFRVGLVAAALFLALLAWARVRLLRAAEFEPTVIGEVTVVAVVGGSQPARNNAAPRYSVMVRVPSGRELYAVVPEPLPPGEHLWAEYSVAKERSVIRMASYKRCGMKTCALDAELLAPVDAR